MSSESIIIAFIENSMKIRGIEEYQFEPVYYKVDTSYSVIEAGNDYYYLNTKTIPAGLTIVSDLDLFAETEDFANMKSASIKEFKGTIQIEASTSGVELEFIRVVPFYKN